MIHSLVALVRPNIRDKMMETNMLNLTTNEMERLLYVQGNTDQADFFDNLKSAEEIKSKIKDAQSDIEECKGCFPEEGLLSPVTNRLIDILQSRITKAKVEEILVILEDIEEKINHASEYGQECIKNAENSIVAIEEHYTQN